MHPVLVGILLGVAQIGSCSLSWTRWHCSSHLPVQGGLWKEGKHGKMGKRMETGDKKEVHREIPASRIKM